MTGGATIEVTIGASSLLAGYKRPLYLPTDNKGVYVNVYCQSGTGFVKYGMALSENNKAKIGHRVVTDDEMPVNN
jgi:hypothetical protein